MKPKLTFFYFCIGKSIRREKFVKMHIFMYPKAKIVCKIECEFYSSKRDLALKIVFWAKIPLFVVCREGANSKILE